MSISNSDIGDFCGEAFELVVCAGTFEAAGGSEFVSSVPDNTFVKFSDFDSDNREGKLLIFVLLAVIQDDKYIQYRSLNVEVLFLSRLYT